MSSDGKINIFSARFMSHFCSKYDFSDPLFYFLLLYDYFQKIVSFAIRLTIGQLIHFLNLQP